MESLVSLLHADAVMSMPPFDFWLQGTTDIVGFLEGPGSACRGSKLLATAGNGRPAFGSYKPDAEGGWSPWSLQVLELSGGRILGYHNFIDAALFPAFGLPEHLPA
jgi:RNA polymerase sigma-70 factor (ECF subfamily)